MNSVESGICAAVAELRAAGFAVCRIRPGEKRPTDPGWSTRSLEADDFGDGDSVGIVCGPFSAPAGFSLVCVDLDSSAAVSRADEFLPATGMIDGRPGKPRAHRWYVVPNESVPEGAHSKAPQGSAAAREQYGHSGPFKKQFKNAAGVHLDFIGTGGQSVVPPSGHSSGERREWDGGTRGNPATVDFPTLWGAVCDLAAAVGCDPKPLKRDPVTSASADDTSNNADPDDSGTDTRGVGVCSLAPVPLTDPARLAEAERRYRGYLEAVAADPPQSGHGADAATLRLLAAGRIGFLLPADAVRRAFSETVNAALKQLDDAWTDADLARKLDWLDVRGAHPDYPPGHLLEDPRYAGPPEAWNDPNRLARSFLKRRDCVRVGDRLYVFTGAVYERVSDGVFLADVREHCQAAAQDDYGRRVRDHDQQRPALMEGEIPDDEERKKRESKHQAKVDKHEQKKPKAVAAVDRKLVGEVVAAVHAQCQQPDATEPGDWLTSDAPPGRFVSVANGLLDLGTFELRSHTPAYFGLTLLPVAVDPAAPPPGRFLAVVDELLEGDAERVAVLQELFGACLDPWLKVKFFAALVGSGDNGKSVILAVLNALLGARNVSAVSLDRLATERFAAFEMHGKLANLCGDQSHFESKDEGRLKTFTGGDRVTFEQKGRDTFSAHNTAKLIFACNTPPTFGDKSDAVWNRLVMLPFTYTVPAERKNPALLDPATWTAELPGVLNWAIDGLKRLRAQRGFTRSAACEALKGQHREQSDPVRLFLSEQLDADPAGVVPTSDIDAMYRSYRSWCDESGLNHRLTRLAFSKSVGRCFAGAKSTVTTRDGKSVRVWRGVRLRSAGATGTTAAIRAGGNTRSAGRQAEPLPLHRDNIGGFKDNTGNTSPFNPSHGRCG